MRSSTAQKVNERLHIIILLCCTHAKQTIVPFSRQRAALVPYQLQRNYDKTVHTTPEQPQVNSTANEYKTEFQETGNKRPQQLT